ncbi:hypothetical protein N7452_002410 [Penicillium brevicompactum]|uniref:Uncharacterized protein n=1 Tax=Penicillium brevicompactum TaxID=5074 RepID=A0A9W9QRI8_PENBR|nr:hypothetical protein N7452_002410 [Penicillium brevicompactum]
MNTFLYLVIKGIYDYLDSHKNKAWLSRALNTFVNKRATTTTFSRYQPTQAMASLSSPDRLLIVTQRPLIQL